MTTAGWVFVTLLLAAAVPVAYLYMLACGASLRRGQRPTADAPRRFAVAIPAHDEAAVIGRTVGALRRVSYPSELVDVHVVADHCTDDTAALAREAGAVCHERTEGPRGGKAAALAWLFDRLWETGIAYDGVCVIDADTQVDPGFFWAMSARLAGGEAVVQGRHSIRNPEDGWYPALSDAMFRLNNRIFNQGRVDLGLSAMHMGDSICFRSDILRELGWGEGLTEDYDLRIRLLLAGVRIAYEPGAVGYGEAPATWAIAAQQRQRWLAGTYGSTRRRLKEVLRAGLKRRDPVLLDAAAQMLFPAYSTLTVVAGAALAVQLGIKAAWPQSLPNGLLIGWAAVIALLAVFPVLGLALDRAPRRAYLAVAMGPFFVLWRTWLAVKSRFLRRPVEWVRTPRRGARTGQDSQDLHEVQD